ncbi:MAG: serine/threonine protein kinase [Pirellulales bacterium]|nr:serine/threonine protein kinase [Pirellulales bacterium]
MTSDRNLLFATLALQMDFINRDQLVAAMGAWVLDKNKPLDELLVEHGALKSDNRELLATLVQRHIDIHDGDAQKSLRSLGSASSTCQFLEQSIPGSVVQATLSIASADRVAAKSSLAETDFSLLESTSNGMRFKILRPHAKGGIGEVSVAQDTELHREVALKEIQAQYADDPNSRARFMLEAEVTGSLEHPGIVPVYGLGQYNDGRPYYAMRFIRGESLKETIERFHEPETKRKQDAAAHGLELRKLLGRLIDVCNAIEYAHSRGVLHRDLKPGNVMLGKYGETLVVDWGLAKPVGRAELPRGKSDELTLQPGSASGSTPTQMGSAIGTPAYMSPEQAAGRLQELSQASDVYSLGAILYTVLTGRPPFESETTIDEVLRRVKQGDFPSPRQRDGAVPLALEAICLKAMATNPKARYASPSDLAGDLEHWLADEPVSAYRESLSQRLSRWERKNRSFVRAGGAALFFVAAASLAAAFGINGARQQETLQRMRADENAQRERSAADAARTAERAAQANLERAQVAEAETVRALARAEAEAASSEEVSDFLVNLFLGSDPSGLGGGLGDIDARGKEMSAVGLLEYGAKTLDDRISTKSEVRARLMNTLGFIFTTYAEFDTAMPLLNESLKIRREIFDDNHPELAQSLKDSGLFYFLWGDYRKAREYDREALAIRQRHFGPKSGPAADTMFQLGWHISTGYTNATLLKESEQLLREAITIQESLYGPKDQRTIFSRLALAYTLIAQERTGEAMLLAVAATKQLSAANGDQRPAGIISNMVLGMAAERKEQWHEAVDHMRKSQELARGVLGERHPIVLYFQTPIVNYLERAGEYAAAEQSLRDLVEAERRSVPEGPWVSYRLEDLAHFLSRRNRYDEADRCYEEALRMRRKTLGEDSLLVGSILNSMGEAALQHGDLARADKLFQESISVYDTATEDHPVTVEEWRTLAVNNLTTTRKQRIEPAASN